MIFLDANYFLRYLIQPATPEARAMHDIATVLFQAVERGEEEVTTTEVVLHEVTYVLASKAHYGLAPDDIAAYLRPILRLSGFRLPRGQKTRYLRALDLWAARPRLGFADAVVAAAVEQLNVPLATFDNDFDGIPSIVRWRPPVSWDGKDMAKELR